MATVKGITKIAASPVIAASVFVGACTVSGDRQLSFEGDCEAVI